MADPTKTRDIRKETAVVVVGRDRSGDRLDLGMARPPGPPASLETPGGVGY